MVALYLNCLICGCGWGKEVITNSKLFKKYFTYDDDDCWCEWPENIINDAVANGKITQEIGDSLRQSIQFLPNHQWLNDVVAVQPEGIVDVTLQEGDSYEVFDRSGKEYFFYNYDINRDNYQTKAYIMHKNCYKLLKNNNYDVGYHAFVNVDNIQPKARTKISKQLIDNNCFQTGYGIADEFIGEYGVFYEHLAYIWNPSILEDPLSNNENAHRILNLEKPLKKEPRIDPFLATWNEYNQSESVPNVTFQ